MRLFRDCINFIRPLKSPSQKVLKCMSYDTIMWISFIGITVFAVIERLTVNYWPLGVDTKLSSSYKWSVNVFLAWSMISGRISIVTTSLLFLTQCRVTMNYLASKCPTWLYIGDIHAINNKVHEVAGWLTGIAILLHVWLIYFPVIVDSLPVQYLSSQSLRKTIPFYNPKNHSLSLAPDDVWRLIEMTMIFCVLIPLSRWTRITCCLPTRYSIAMMVHVFAGIMFAIDIIRKKSHPHSKIFNIPVVIYYFIDRLVGMYIYRRGVASISHYILLDDDQYILLFLKLEDRHTFQNGEFIYLHFKDIAKDKKYPKRYFEYAHPFTVWANRGSLVQSQSDNVSEDKKFLNTDINRCTPKISFSSEWKSSKNIKEFRWQRKDTEFLKIEDNVQIDVKDKLETEHTIDFPTDYDIACIVKVSKNRRKACAENHQERPMCLPCQMTWTEELLDRLKLNQQTQSSKNLRRTKSYYTVHPTQTTLFTYYGPYHNLFQNLRVNPQDLPALVFIASGAGAAPLIDFHQYIVHYNVYLVRPVAFLYTCNSAELFEYVASILMCHHIHNFSCHGWITKGNSGTVEHSYELSMPNVSQPDNRRRKSRDIKSVNIRLPLREELLSSKTKLGITDVFFCGNATIKKEIEKHCKDLDLSYNVGHIVS